MRLDPTAFAFIRFARVLSNAGFVGRVRRARNCLVLQRRGLGGLCGWCCVYFRCSGSNLSFDGLELRFLLRRALYLNKGNKAGD